MNTKILLDKIEKSKFFEKFGMKNPWISGASTYVWPIEHTIDMNRIDIQIDSLVIHKGMINSFKALYKKLEKEFNLDCWFYYKGDGSCPQVFTIWYK